MVITHHGGQCFKVTFGDITLVFDPISKGGTLPAVRFGADIALVSRNHPDMNGVAEVTYGGKASASLRRPGNLGSPTGGNASGSPTGGKEPFAIKGPGEYEYGGVAVQGFLTHSAYGLKKEEKEAVNTVYAVKLEGMTLVHLGALSDAQLPPEAKEGIDEIDVLFVPVGGKASGSPTGGNGVLNASQAAKLATMLEPRIIIPMHWSGMGEPKALESYLKEEGGSTGKTDKLTLKKKDALDKDGDIIVITP